MPQKNTRLLGGNPLIAYTIASALKSRLLSKIILSTDDSYIASIGKERGIEVPFMRPTELARDDTPTLPVLQHAVRWFEERGERYEGVCLLQPTNPFRPASWIDGCIARFWITQADSVVTVLPVPAEFNPHWVYFDGPAKSLRLSTGERDPIPRRQLLPRAWHREGSVYVCSRSVLMGENSLFGQRLVGYRVSDRRSANIDTPADWAEAERRLAGDARLSVFA